MTKNLSDQILLQAATWYETFNDLNEAEYDAFLDWLDASPDHKRAFDSIEQTALDPALLSAADEIERQTHKAKPSPSPKEFLQAIFGVLGGWRLIGGSLIATCMALVVFLNSNNGVNTPNTPIEVQQFATSRGVTSKHELADGSIITLNAQTSVESKYSTQDRVVALNSGGALFNVASDADRPFTVYADDITATALGTIYEVDRIAGSTEIRVYEGRVRVSRGGAVLRDIGAGEWVLISNGLNFTFGTFSLTPQPNWVDGWMQAENVELQYVVERLNRYRNVPIRIEQGSLGRAKVTGRFNLLQGDDALELIATQHSAHITRLETEILLKSDHSGAQ